MNRLRGGAPIFNHHSRRMGWTYRLYIRIYMAVLASLAVAALLFAIVAHVNSDAGQFGATLQTFSEIAAEVLPPATAPPEAQRAALIRWQHRVRADLALYAADGSQIAEAGLKMPPLPADQVDSGWMHGHPQILVLKLPDGRWLLEQRMHWRHLSSVGLLVVLALVALAIAAGAYPIVRRLTRRLERLQHSVDSWGSGQLSTRVPVEGHDEVARLAVSFNRSAAQIESLVNAQRSLLANASHELRSPLARIRMAVELMRGQADPMAGEELTRNIGELDQLIDEILLASRLGAVSDNLQALEEFDLTALVAEECAQTEAQLDAGRCSMRGEPKLIRRMVRNLLENARRYGAGTQIDVSLGSNETHAIQLDVCDRGPGVPEAERERIFAPFYRMPGARESDGGVGLGLSLVRQIAHRHGGEVACLARDGGGSCFRVTLPG
jgi:signal transduction histidine kinase